jgi:hypothetical protein
MNRRSNEEKANLVVLTIALRHLVACLAEVLAKLRIHTELLANRVAGNLPDKLVRPAFVSVLVPNVRDGLLVEGFDLQLGI